MADGLEEYHSQFLKIDEGSDCVADVTQNWGQIIRSISLAANSLATINTTTKDGNVIVDESSSKTARLVRCKLDEDGRITDKSG
ncbi:unnamed protein product [Ambrosiozyma monospora]|nr:unnamed protein product [Ambrosiozyma monospora]